MERVRSSGVQLFGWYVGEQSHYRQVVKFSLKSVLPHLCNSCGIENWQMEFSFLKSFPGICKLNFVLLTAQPSATICKVRSFEALLYKVCSLSLDRQTFAVFCQIIEGLAFGNSYNCQRLAYLGFRNKKTSIFNKCIKMKSTYGIALISVKHPNRFKSDFPICQ